MSSAELRELNAYYALFSTYALPKTVTTPSDLSDGAALWVVLSSVCVAVHEHDYYIELTALMT
jgi:hypothetical protein